MPVRSRSGSPRAPVAACHDLKFNLSLRVAWREPERARWVNASRCESSRGQAPTMALMLLVFCFWISQTFPLAAKLSLLNCNAYYEVLISFQTKYTKIYFPLSQKPFLHKIMRKLNKKKFHKPFEKINDNSIRIQAKITAGKKKKDLWRIATSKLLHQ